MFIELHRLFTKYHKLQKCHFYKKLEHCLLQMFITNLQKVNIAFYETSFRNVEIENIEKRVLEVIRIRERYEIYTGENT